MPGEENIIRTLLSVSKFPHKRDSSMEEMLSGRNKKDLVSFPQQVETREK